MLAGIRSRQETTALLVPFVAWSGIAFVLPQIGTAARPVALLNPIASAAQTGGSFDILAAITGPLSVTEQFKRAANALLNNAGAVGDAALGTAVLLVFVGVLAGIVASSSRTRLRSDLND